MVFEPAEASDATLLTMCQQIRFAADKISEHIAQHMSSEHDHPLSECQLGLLYLAEILTTLSGMCTVSAANMLAAVLGSMGVEGFSEDTE
jgi:hypothetical protein